MTTTYQRLAGSWSQTTAAAGCGDQLYAVDGTILYRVDPKTGTHAALTNRWQTRFLVGFGTKLYAWETDGALYAASAEDGSYQRLGGTWNRVAAATSTRDGLCVAIDQSLYSVDPKTGDRTRLPGRWDPVHLIGIGAFVFAWEKDGALYRIDARTGSYTPLPGNWPLTTAVAAARDALFAIDNGTLYQVDPRSGSYQALGTGYRSELLVGVGSYLCSIEDGALYRLLD